MLREDTRVAAVSTYSALIHRRGAISRLHTVDKGGEVARRPSGNQRKMHCDSEGHPPLASAIPPTPFYSSSRSVVPLRGARSRHSRTWTAPCLPVVEHAADQFGRGHTGGGGARK